MTNELTSLLDELAAVPVTQHREQIEFTIADARSLIHHGEAGVAFENVCQNLYEFDFPLSRAHYERLERLGQHYGFKSDTWSFLQSLVA